MEPNFDGIVIRWSFSKIVSGSHALPPRWPPQYSCVVIESFDPGERLQAPGSLWFYYYSCESSLLKNNMEFILVKVKNLIFWEYVYKVYYIKTRDFHFVPKILNQIIVGSFCQKHDKTQQYELGGLVLVHKVYVLRYIQYVHIVFMCC